eukprot:12983488-Alexandrium_andersonii.AAC.1
MPPKRRRPMRTGCPAGSAATPGPANRRGSKARRPAACSSSQTRAQCAASLGSSGPGPLPCSASQERRVAARHRWPLRASP